MSTYEKFEKESHAEKVSDFYCYLINGDTGFVFSYCFDLLYVMITTDKESIKNTVKDAKKIKDFVSYEDMFEDFQNEYKKLTEHGFKVYNIKLVDEDPRMIVLLPRCNLVFVPATKELTTYPFTLVDQLLNEDDEYMLYKKEYNDIRKALEDPIFLDYRDVLDRL